MENKNQPQRGATLYYATDRGEVEKVTVFDLAEYVAVTVDDMPAFHDVELYCSDGTYIGQSFFMTADDARKSGQITWPESFEADADQN